MPNDDAARPVVIVVDDEPLNRAFVESVVAGTEWRVVAVESGEAALARLDDVPALILMDLHLGGMGGVEATAAIRARGDAAAGVPIVAFTTTRLTAIAPLHARGFDDTLEKPCTPAALLAMLDRWRPDGVATSLPRLEQVFGKEAIDDMAARYAALLEEAIGALDQGAATDIAHRLAGISGTLGFSDLGARWLALSLGEETDVAILRRDTRRTASAIQRRAP